MSFSLQSRDFGSITGLRRQKVIKKLPFSLKSREFGSVLRGMVAIHGIFVAHAVYMGSSWGPRAEEHIQVEGKWKSLGPTNQ